MESFFLKQNFINLTKNNTNFKFINLYHTILSSIQEYKKTDYLPPSFICQIEVIYNFHITSISKWKLKDLQLSQSSFHRLTMTPKDFWPLKSQKIQMITSSQTGKLFLVIISEIVAREYLLSMLLIKQ